MRCNPKWADKAWNKRAVDRSDHNDDGKPGNGPKGCKRDEPDTTDTIVLTALSGGAVVQTYDEDIFSLTGPDADLFRADGSDLIYTGRIGGDDFDRLNDPEIDIAVNGIDTFVWGALGG